MPEYKIKNNRPEYDTKNVHKTTQDQDTVKDKNAHSRIPD